MDNNFRATPQAMIERSGALIQSVQVSVTIISLVSFKQTTIFSCLSCKQPPPVIITAFFHLHAILAVSRTNHAKSEKKENKPTKVEKGVQNITAAKLQTVFHNFQI